MPGRMCGSARSSSYPASRMGADLAQTSMFRSFSGLRVRGPVRSAGRFSSVVSSGVTAHSFASRNPRQSGYRGFSTGNRRRQGQGHGHSVAVAPVRAGRRSGCRPVPGRSRKVCGSLGVVRSPQRNQMSAIPLDRTCALGHFRPEIPARSGSQGGSGEAGAAGGAAGKTGRPHPGQGRGRPVSSCGRPMFLPGARCVTSRRGRSPSGSSRRAPRPPRRERWGRRPGRRRPPGRGERGSPPRPGASCPGAGARR